MSAATAAPVAMHRGAAPEDVARADFYALLARLLIAAPDGGLLASLASASPMPVGGDPDLARAWQGLIHASTAMDADAAADEFGVLFEGVGKAAISVYAGYYSGAPSIDHPRVRIQEDLAALGLGRAEAVSEPEDHFAGLFEAMRVLAAGGAGRDPAPLARQKAFFQAHLEPGLAKFFAALRAAPPANYYRHVADVGAAFAALESASFRME